MNTFFTSDTHFGHNNVLKFTLRPYSSVEEMDEALIENWNAVVGPHDRVYHLGDFAWTPKRAIEVRPRLNGNIRLIVGNHDKIPDLVKAGLFQRVSMWRIFDEHRFIASHVPLSLVEVEDRGCRWNIHGHKHDDVSTQEAHHINVCVENTGYAPVPLETIISIIDRKSE